MTNGNEKQTVEVAIECDTDRLYGSLGTAIKYLQEIRDKHKGKGIILDEHWFGYEDMELRFLYYRDETDAELNDRIEQERSRAEQAAEEKREKLEREAKFKQYNDLKDELGIRR